MYLTPKASANRLNSISVFALSMSTKTLACTTVLLSRISAGYFRFWNVMVVGIVLDSTTYSIKVVFRA